MAVRPLHASYALIGCFFVAERLLRRGESARSWEEGTSDPGTTRAIGTAFGTSVVALLTAPLLNRLRIGRRYGDGVAWSGVVLMALGLCLRIWATLVLGAFYTRTLRTTSEQHLITTGPYSRVRNPGYLGVIVLWLGAGVASANCLVMLLIAFPILRAYRRRIEAEERMLAGAFGREYEAYAARTWRLIPFAY